MKVSIRKATLHDLDELIRLRLELLFQIDHSTRQSREYVAEANRRYFQRMIPTSDFETWVADTGSCLVACGSLLLIHRLPHGENIHGVDGYVMNMYTQSGWRKHGLATRILSQLVSYAADKNAKLVWLRASEEGRSLYIKTGFQPQSTYMDVHC